MCGRFFCAADGKEIAERFNARPADFAFAPSYNIAPTQIVPVIVNINGYNEVQPMRWGLLPHWAKNRAQGTPLINARLETLAQKPAFSDAIRRRRCLVPANGYYEWQQTAAGKIPMCIVPQAGSLVAFAGVWEQWLDPAGERRCSFAIITTEPVAAVKSIHHRMPLILPHELESYWLQGPPEFNLATLKSFLANLIPLHELDAYQVSKTVNSPTHNTPECIKRLDGQRE